jgi:SAM-dependent methyltransferase
MHLANCTSIASDLFCCPACNSELRAITTHLTCSNPDCGVGYPVVNSIPILLDERRSVFSFTDFVGSRATFFPRYYKLVQFAQTFVPSVSANLKARKNYANFAEILTARSTKPRVLVIGGSIIGAGMDALANNPAIELIATDVAFGPNVSAICDAHALPFPKQSFDGVIVQAVLEHVADPHQCVEEIYRVLKPEGVIYAETPFIQQVHGGKYDFTRFTDLGHRRLFRRFTEIDRGAVGGPGMALAWSYSAFLVSFTKSRLIAKMIRAFAAFTSFFLKYFDYFLIDRPGALDAASGYYFLGSKSACAITDRELIGLYRGLQRWQS